MRFADLPSVFSGNGIGFIDPHREFFEIQLPGCRSKDKTTTYRWLLDRDKEEINRLQHQFEPFLQPLFGVSRSTFDAGNFKGTIFRFPLRSKDMKSSDLSKTTYDQEKVKDLVKSLRADAHHMLLFLRNLRSIEVFEKTSAGQPKKLLDIRIAAPYLDTVRKNCAEFEKQIDCEWKTKSAVSATYPVAYSVEDNMDSQASGQTDTFTWIVSQYYGGALEGRHIRSSIDRTYLPFVGVAVQVGACGNEDLWKTDPAGHVFCFLPLPLEKKSPTGLRFHVHGSFAIDQNRRHIKWPSADRDMARVVDSALIWNKFLVGIVLPSAVYRMIAFLIKLKAAQHIPEELRVALQKAERENPEFTANLIYSMIPDDALVTAQWKDLSTGIYRVAFDQRLFYSPVSGGKWLHYEDAIFDCSRDKDTLAKLLRRILYEDQRNLVSVPQHIHTQLPMDSRHISASIVCESLKNIQSDVKLTDKERTILLGYLSEQLSDLKSLIGLELIPLANESWITFKASSSEEKVYICSSDHPKELLPGMEHKILKTDYVPLCVNDWATKGKFSDAICPWLFVNS